MNQPNIESGWFSKPAVHQFCWNVGPLDRVHCNLIWCPLPDRTLLRYQTFWVGQSGPVIHTIGDNNIRLTIGGLTYAIDNLIISLVEEVTKKVMKKMRRLLSLIFDNCHPRTLKSISIGPWEVQGHKLESITWWASRTSS